MTIFRFVIRRSFGNKSKVIFLVLVPIVCIFFPEGEGWPHLPFGYQYFGIVLLFAGMRLASIMLEDRTLGVVRRLAVAPISHFRYLSQNLLGYAVILIMQCMIIVVGGALAGRELYEPLWLLVLYMSFSFTAIAIALAWISIYRNKETASLVYMSFIFLFAILGGLLIPIEIFPALLQKIAVLFPTYWLSEGIKWVVFGSNGLDFLLINAVLWLYTLVFLIIGSTRKIH